MSKKSVFKFNIGNSNKEELVKKLINNYLNENGFVFDSEKQCYLTNQSGIAMAPTQIVNDLPRDIEVGYTSTWGFQYNISNNYLTIKAFTNLYNPNIKFLNSNDTNFIHAKINKSPAGAQYYENIKNNLFQELSNNDIELLSEEIEKINDGSSIRFIFLIIGIILACILLLGMLVFILKILSN